MKKSLFLSIITVLFFSCQRGNKIEHVERAFYYWKSDESEINSKEYKIIDTVGVTKLYFKYFEVKHDATLGNIPISKNSFYQSYFYSDRKKDSLQIVPTIFIKNDVFLKSNKAEIDTLVSNMDFLISKYSRERFANHSVTNEIQIDCDWTIKSKENYFYFLKALAKVSKKELSCTLRLYPYKYRNKMGIPPVKKATLMCYNLIQPFADHRKNSILDIKELDSYLTVDAKYPIHLDVALPIFSWGHHYQYDQFKEFVKIDDAFLKKACTKKSELWYEVKKDTTVGDVYYRIGDKIKYESITQDKIEDAIIALKSKVSFDKSTTVTFFHLDSTIIKKYNYETLDRFYTSFSN